MLGAIASAGFAALVAIGTTMAIERWGGRTGGLIGTMPTTIVPASLGIAATGHGDEALVLAMCAVPMGMVVDALFLYLWRVLPPHLPPWSLRHRLVAMSILSLAMWGLGAVAAVSLMQRLHTGTKAAVTMGVAGTALIIVVGVLACRSAPPAPRGTRPVSALMLLGRGVLAGVAIGVSVLIAKLGSPLAAGVAAVFPAIFITTMVALWLSQGEAVQAGAVGPMMLGSSAVATYALFAAVAIPALGMTLGVICAWLGAIVTTTLPSWWWLSSRGEAQS